MFEPLTNRAAAAAETIEPEKVFVAQKWMIEKANLAAKPIITATQMLESMIKAPRPTRAEASDVANAVLDGTDAVMLSGETANGLFPLHAVEFMSRACCEAERYFDYAGFYKLLKSQLSTPIAMEESIALEAVKLTHELQSVDLIVLRTDTGKIAHIVSKYHPRVPVLAGCLSTETVYSLLTTRGVTGLALTGLEPEKPQDSQ